MSTTSLILVIALPLVASAVIALILVRGGRTRAEARLREVPGPVLRTTAATSLGLATLGAKQVRGTGTLVLTDSEVAFAQWRPDRLVRIPRAAIHEVDTTQVHLGKTMKNDLLRIRWASAEAGVEDTVAFFVRDLEPWLQDLGGSSTPP